jgi:hypothetical protein
VSYKTLFLPGIDNKFPSARFVMSHCAAAHGGVGPVIRNSATNRINFEENSGSESLTVSVTRIVKSSIGFLGLALFPRKHQLIIIDMCIEWFPLV